ncbi:ATP-binding protein [Microbacterium sp. LMC-P-041]|uniref:AlbA family DNA-binding domain-containing protein n=1 Tax=Microbacterium sp. LMC-P-041 TaxID=3040293 RepID=UPI002557C4DB|nr:ATP-binding protein [Microbacterium sp. LMC-P-041]
MLFTALHRLLGRAAGPITAELIDAAVENHIAEADDLDWKRELPPTKGLSATDFPKDVAAMANSGGGVIVYGVEEEQKRAIARRDVGELSENHERTLRAAAYGAITPPVFVAIHTFDDAGKRGVAVVVPASVDGPHLIFKEKFFGAPLRNDADTEWMKEREIEAAYRARLDDRRHSAAALVQLYEEAAADWSDSQRAVLIAVARPRLSPLGSGRVDREVARSVFRRAETLGQVFADPVGVHPLVNVVDNPRPGLRRWVAVNAHTAEKTLWRAARASVHEDGAVSMVATVGGHRKPSGGEMRDSQVDSAAIECAVSDFLALVRTWSELRGVRDQDVRVGIEWPHVKPLLIQTVDQSGYPYDGTSVPLKRYVPVSATIDAGAADEEYLSRVYEVAEDCVNQGGIKNVRMIKRAETGG